MANRNMQQKLRKLRRRYRFARFSGGHTRFVKTRVDTVVVHEGEDKTKLKEIEVPVGPIHLSKQVPKGKGPNQERMQEYYGRVSKESFAEPLPVRTSDQMVEWLEQYKKVWDETPKERKLNLAITASGRLDLFFRTGCYFVEVNYKLEFFRISREYSDKKTALDRLKNNRITWVEQFPK